MTKAVVAGLAVFVTHCAIDFVKSRSSQSGKAFLADQAAHFAVLGILAFVFLPEIPAVDARLFTALALVAGLSTTVFGSGYLVGAVTSSILRESQLEVRGGLLRGGEVIGRLERLLIFVLVMVGQPAGIGFLVAAKSVLRMEESKTRQLITSGFPL